MPGNNSWNGKWSGDGKCFVIVKSFRKMPAELKIGYHTYDFGDGWSAAISVREVDKGTAAMLRKKSQGFCGYDWMVSSLISYGKIMRDDQIRAMLNEKKETVKS